MDPGEFVDAAHCAVPQIRGSAASPGQVKLRLLLDTLYCEALEHQKLNNHLCFCHFVTLLPVRISGAFFWL